MVSLVLHSLDPRLVVHAGAHPLASSHADPARTEAAAGHFFLLADDLIVIGNLRGSLRRLLRLRGLLGLRSGSGRRPECRYRDHGREQSCDASATLHDELLPTCLNAKCQGMIPASHLDDRSITSFAMRRQLTSSVPINFPSAKQDSKSIRAPLHLSLRWPASTRQQFADERIALFVQALIYSY